MTKAEKRKAQEDLQKNIAWMYGRNEQEAKHDPDKRAYVPTKKFVDIDAIRTFDGTYRLFLATFINAFTVT